MAQNRRITTDYVRHEDRIRITSGGDENPTLIVWVTRRLMDQVVQVLCDYVAKNTDAADHPDPTVRSAVAEMAQQSASASLVPQQRVTPDGADAEWLADTINIRGTAKEIRLHFLKGEDQSMAMTLTTTALRQWLQIVRKCYADGEWAADRFPDWIHDPKTTEAPPSERVIH